MSAAAACSPSASISERRIDLSGEHGDELAGSPERPRPGPSTTAAARFAAVAIGSAAPAARPPSAAGIPRDITSVSLTSKIGSSSSGTATVA